MPLVIRATDDMFAFEYISEIIVIPCNCSGKLSRGIGEEAARKWPDWFRSYYAACKSEQLKIGRLHVYQINNNNKYVVSLPTKDFYGDNTNIDELARSIGKLRQFLQTKPELNVVMPMFTNVFKRGDPEAIRVSQEDVYGMLLVEKLHDLPNIIHLCMRPTAMDRIPRYLGVFGTRDLHDYAFVKAEVEKALKQWELTPADFDGIVSGGAIGTDACAIMGVECPFVLADTPNARKRFVGHKCLFAGDKEFITITKENFASLVGKTVECVADLASEWNLPPILVRPATGTYGQAGLFVRNRTIADILTHGVAFQGSKSHGTKHTINCVHQINEGYAEDRLLPPKGKEGLFIPEDKLLVVVKTDTL